MSTTTDYDVLLRFEDARKSDSLALEQFLTHSSLSANSQLQLELVALDIEIRLQCGDRVEPDHYLLEYPHLGERIFTIYDEVKTNFLKTYCPITRGETELPCQFANYLVEEELGRGGMGVVYRAVHSVTQAEVALKVLFCADPLHEEANALSKLNHSTICKLFEVGDEEGTPYISMELIEGDNLKTYLKSALRLDTKVATDVVLQAAEGLAHAHEVGIVHFDVKTSNLHYSNSGKATILDFGLAAPEEHFNCPVSDETKTFGSPSYLAPEFLNHEFGKPGFQSDIYALGVVLYELLTGTVPFLGGAEALAFQICHQPPSRPTDFPDSQVDPQLEKICLKAMSKHANDRHKNMSELAAELAQWKNANAYKVA